jgi:hypothetical protein
VSERTTPTPPTTPGRWTLTRDIASFILGWGLIIYEVRFQPSLREPVLLLAGAVVGVPGLALGASSVAESLRSRAGTPSPPDPSPSAVSPPSPPS